MAHPSRAFKNNPLVDAKIDLDYRASPPCTAAGRVQQDGSDVPIDPEKSFAKAHYEQHIAGTGSFEIGGQRWEIDGFACATSRGVRATGQNISWYRLAAR